MASDDEELSSYESDSSLLPPEMKRQMLQVISSDEEFSSDTSSDVGLSHRVSRCGDNIYSSTDDECKEDACSKNKDTNVKIPETDWSDPVGKQPCLIPFTGKSGFTLVDRNCNTVEEIYMLLVSNEIFQIIVEQTNLYASQVLQEKQSTRLNEWTPTNVNELKRFFGLIIWMGFVKLPEVHLYWSKDPIFTQTFPPSIMSRNRFEILLRMLHFANNESITVTDRLYKVKVIIDKLNESFSKYYNPGEILCVGESLIPFGKRVIPQHYTKQNRNKHGIRILKLCSAPGYTYNFQIYCRNKLAVHKTTPTNAIMSLCNNIFSKGHTLCTDDWYTSIDLAKKLITKNTHLIGTARLNLRGIPKEIITKKLNQGEQFVKEHKTGITLLKWKNQRDVLFLSTKHSVEAINAKKRGRDCIKPKVVIDYNEGMSYSGMSDQMKPYCSPLRRNVKWYRKIAIELLLNTAVVNAWIIYNIVTSNNIPSLEFRKRLAMYLTHCQDESCGNDYVPHTPITILRDRHEMKKKEGKFTTVRRRCYSCYKNNVKKFGTKLARDSTTKVVTYCDDCPGKPHLCLPCFNTEHRNKSP